MSQNNYSEIERGKVKLSIERLNKIAEILEINPDDLLSFEESLSFRNKNHKGGNQIYVNLYPEKLAEVYEARIKDLKEENSNLKEQISFFKKLINKQSEK